MYARSTTVHGNPQSLDAATTYLRDKVMPAVLALDGFVGLSMLADPGSGRCIATTAWKSEAAMHDSEGPLHMLRRRYAEILGGSPEVREWEIAVLHRLRHAPVGACARVVWSRTDPANREGALDVFRLMVLPRMEELPGFCSVSVLADLEDGGAVTATVFESREAMDRTAEGGARMRDQYASQTGGEITEVAEFDLALAHLRVPETV
jgi:heme-degrading monooxygenase HmoA